VLLTRAPLTRVAPDALDLHVLGLPPAFVLSQDQTLIFIYMSSNLSVGFDIELTLCLGRFRSLDTGCTFGSSPRRQARFASLLSLLSSFQRTRSTLSGQSPCPRCLADLRGGAAS
jgi:hypothetical protein